MKNWKVLGAVLEVLVNIFSSPQRESTDLTDIFGFGGIWLPIIPMISHQSIDLQIGLRKIIFIDAHSLFAHSNFTIIKSSLTSLVNRFFLETS
jgi:hypothetical protein